MRKRSARTPAALALAVALSLAGLVLGAPGASARPEAPAAVLMAGTRAVAAQATTAPATITTTSVVTQIDDPASTRTVNRIIAALLVLGGVLAAVTIWFWVATKPLHPALEGLDLMSHRRWAHAAPDKQQRMLDKVHGSRGPIDERLVPLGPAGGPTAAPVPVGRARGDHTPPP